MGKGGATNSWFTFTFSRLEDALIVYRSHNLITALSSFEVMLN